MNFILQSKDLMVQIISIILPFLGGGILSLLLMRNFHPKSTKVQKFLHGSKFSFFAITFCLQTLFLPFLSLVFESPSNLVQLALFAEGVLIFTSLVNALSSKPLVRILGGSFASLLFAFHLFGLLSPSLAYLQSVTFKIGSTTLSLFGVIKAIFATAALVWGALGISGYLERQLKRQGQLKPSVRLLVSKALKTILMAFSFYIGLTFLGIDLSAFSIFAGAIGVGIAFGLQNILSNFFSGFIILVERSIKPGDVISLGDGKVYGVVDKLYARYVSVRTREGKEHLIPNQEIITNKVENWSYSDPCVRMEIPFRVSYDSDLELVEKLLVEIAINTSRVMKKPTPCIKFSSLIDNAVDLKLFVWVEDPKNGMSGIKSDIIFEVWKAFRAHGIRIPYPPREIYSKAQTFSEEEMVDSVT